MRVTGPRFRLRSTAKQRSCLRSSASSWQEALVPPGGAPVPARVPGLRTRPAGAAPTRHRELPNARHSHFVTLHASYENRAARSVHEVCSPRLTTPRETTLQRTRWQQHRRGLGRGDRFAQPSPLTLSAMRPAQSFARAGSRRKALSLKGRRGVVRAKFQILGAAIEPLRSTRKNAGKSMAAKSGSDVLAK